MNISVEKNEIKDIAYKVCTLLDKNYPKEISFLQFRNNFQLLISVILSAQTTDRQVMAVVPALFEKYPDPLSLSKGTLDDIMDIIKSVGFFRTKATNIKKTAVKLLEDFNSTVPDTIEELLTLPGVGRKSANVVVGSLFEKPAIIVDTHFGRVVRRIGLTQAKIPEKIEKDIALLIPEKKQYRFSMTANLHGRKICHSRKPSCNICFLKSLCKSVPLFC
ncbi:MAG: endonuclease III [Spirochaetaceae bacterium]|nr:endonuclease III [Spirochaetaceae bacterium]